MHDAIFVGAYLRKLGSTDLPGGPGLGSSSGKSFPGFDDGWVDLAGRFEEDATVTVLVHEVALETPTPW